MKTKESLTKRLDITHAVAKRCDFGICHYDVYCSKLLCYGCMGVVDMSFHLVL